MGMRVTTNMAMNLYRYNLGNSTVKMNSSMNTVMTHRKFNSFAEDPTSAVQAWRVRRAMVDNNSYRNNNSDVKSRFNVAFATMDLVTDKLEATAKDADLRGMNDPTAGARVQVGGVLSNTADSVIQAMNSAKYSDHYVFSGTDEMNPPFSWDGEKLYYRGINVNAGGVTNPAERELPEWVNDGTGNEVAPGPMVPKDMPASSDDADEQAWIDYYSDTAITTPPATTPPDWADLGVLNGGTANGTILAADNGNGVAATDTSYYKQVTPEGMPESSDDVYEQAWIDYYNDPVNGYKPNVSPNDLGNAWGESDEFGVPEATKNVTGSDPAYNRLWAEYYKDQGDLARLDMMSKEEQNVDLGMGLMKDENGNLVNGSAFNRALPGINMLGYGVDENGDPNNVILVMKRLGEIFSDCDFETGDFDKENPGLNTPKAQALREEANRLMDKLKLCNDNCNTETSTISTKSHYLNENEERMTLQATYLEEDRYNLEEVDPADAISTFMYDYYCYNAALKVGTQLLSQSLIDYMN